MAHSCRWRFPARPGGSTNSGTGKRAGRIRVTASLRNDSGAQTNSLGPRPGFDAAVQVSAAIESNLQKFRDVLGESSGSSSGEEEVFGGFGTGSESRRIQSPARTFSAPPSAPATPEKKPRGRPPRAQATQRVGPGPAPAHSASSPPPHRDASVSHPEKVKRPPGRPPGSGERRRGRPPASASHRSWHQSGHVASDEASTAGSSGEEHGSLPAQHNKTAASSPSTEEDREGAKVTKLKRLQDVKMGPLKSRLKAVARKGVPVPVVPRRRRGRPPSAERLKAEAAAAAAAAAAARSGSSPGSYAEPPLPDTRTVKQKPFRVRGRDREQDLQATQQQQAAAKLRPPHAEPQTPGPTEPQSPPASKFGRPLGLRQSPRHIKPVRIVPPSKRTDATIAKQLLQRAKKGAQKKKLLEKESSGSGGPPGMEASIRRRRRTPLKNIRQFIMPVVSTVSRRIIKTPKRFIEDEPSFSTPPPMKMSRLDPPAYASVSVATSLSAATVASAPQPSAAPSPTLVATSSPPSSTPVGPGASASVGDSLPPPPPPVVPAVSTNSGGGSGSIPSGLLNNVAAAAAAAVVSGSCNNSTSNGGRFSSSAASCGSSAVSQLSSAESSRSSSPSLDDSSCDSQASEGTQALSEEPDRSPGSSQGEEREEPPLMHPSRPSSPPSEHEHEHEHGHVRLLERGRRGRRGQGVRSGAGLVGRGRSALLGPRKKTIISPATGILISSSQVGAHQTPAAVPSGSSPPPPQHVLGPGQHPPSGSSANPAGDHHPHSSWIMSRGIPPFLTGASMHASCHDKRRSILREPTFRWSSAPSHKPECFSSAKYAKEGLIRKPVFDNFRPPPLTAQDVGLVPGPASGGVPPSGFTASSSGGSGSSGRLFSPLHHHHHPHASSRFEGSYTKRSPLLRAPRFTPSEAHSRIYMSLPIPASSSSSPGSLSPLQGSSPTNRTLRHRKRRPVGSLSGQPRSPSHSMTRRSSQSGFKTGKSSSDHVGSSSGGARDSASLQGVAVSPLAPSALSQPSFALPPGTAGLHSGADGRKAPSAAGAGGLGFVGNSAGSSSSSPSQLFPLFEPGGGKSARERNLSAGHEASAKERERDSERSREREKENKREGRKDKERKAKDASSHLASGLFGVDGKDLEKSVPALTTRKTPGRKKSASADSGAEASPADSNTVGGPPASNGRPSKKDSARPPDWDAETDRGEKDDRERTSTPVPPGQTGKTPTPTATTTTTPSLESMLAHAEKQPVADKQLAGLLKKAKAQLHNIENKSLKSLKPADQPKVQGQESDSSETSVRGPRIKHVCRRAAVALGRNRAVFPDDMPTLSALPWEEREKILSSMGNDDKSSVAGSEEAEPQTPPLKPVTRQKPIHEALPKKGRRSRRCGQCPGCQVPEDCGVCTNCLDKPKFGGRNIKKQCCKVRKCQNLQWMPSKMFIQKQVKGKKDKKRNRMSEKKESLYSVSAPAPETKPALREGPSQKKSDASVPSKPAEEKQKQLQEQDDKEEEEEESSQTPNPSSPPPEEDPSSPPSTPTPEESKQSPALSSASTRKERKLQQQQQQQATSSPTSSHKEPPPPSPPTASQSPGQTPPQRSPHNPSLSKKDSAAKPPADVKKKPQQQQQQTSQPPVPDTGPDTKHVKKLAARCAPAPKPKTKEKQEKEKQVAIKPDGGPLNSLSTPSTGVQTNQQQQQQQTAPCDGVQRIRVDFKESHDIENVWEMGGLSILTSVPITPHVLCFLCASSGNVEFVFCQVCCEAFHLFCLGESERPLQAQLENWCCRRCRFCHVCGHPHQNTKLLECDKCRNSYHPECLGPNHPSRPTKKRVWICTKCVRCQSCGATKPGKAWDARWSHDFSLCHDCAKLVAKGTSCPLCDKCYDEEDYESKMMKCGRCRCWVHAKCESLTDEMYEMLSNLPAVAYTCAKCTDKQPAEWRAALKNKLQSSVHQVLTALLNSRTSTHLLRYRQPVMKPPELNPETEESLPSRRSPEGPDPPVLTEVPPHADSPADLESVGKKMDLGRYKSVLEFSDDIVKIIQAAINADGGQPENKKANSMVKSFFIRQMERAFPWFKVKDSRFWETQRGSNSGPLPNAVLPPFLDHNYAQWQNRMEQSSGEQPSLVKIIPAPPNKPPGEPDSPATSPSQPPQVAHDPSPEGSPKHLPPPDLKDNRLCVLCMKYGDENTNEGGRLLYIGQNQWTHVNCALWSAEVFEDDDGSLKNVHMAVIRGKQLRCENCQRPGATVGCCLTSCNSNYHFMCARQCHCVFLEDKKVYCQKHKDLIKGEVISDSGFEVTRRILVDLEGVRLRRKFMNGFPPDNIHMMIGSMTIDCLGMLTDLSDCERNLFPIGYQCSRVYWSTIDARKRCVYTCRIVVYRPPVVETVTDTIAPCEKNFTIAHNNSTISEMETTAGSPLMKSEKLSCPRPMATASRPKMLFRNRHPSYPPCQKSPLSRPLPSPGGFSSAHEIVTVGDPLLISSFGRIGSRRHSTSSLSSQSSRNTAAPTTQISNLFSSQSTASSSSSISTLSSLSSHTWDRAQRDIGTKGRSFASARSPNCQANASASPGSQQRLSSITEKGDGSREASGKQSEGETVHSSTPLMSGMNQVSPPLGTAVLTSHQRSSSAKSEKGKPGIKDTDLPAESTLLSCQPQAALPKDGGSPIQEGTPPAAKDTGMPGSPKPPYHKSGGRKSHDYVPGPAPAAAMKPRWSSGATVGVEDIKRGSQATPAVTASYRTTSTKETCSKMGFGGSIEVSKEREKSTKKTKTPLHKKGSDIKTLGQDQNFPNSNNKSAVHSSSSSNTKAAGTNVVDKHDGPGGNRPLKSRERFSAERKNSPTLEGMQTGPDANMRTALNQTKARKEQNKRDKKPTGKTSLMSPKIDPNGTKVISPGSETNMSSAVAPVSQGPQRRSACAPILFSSPSASSESSESESQAHPEDCDEHLREEEGHEDGENPSLEDEGSIDKHNEEDSDGSGSAKRRYPRRSTRARANMIFGLTPFYGVRSYGEEDIDFYGGGGVMKKRSGMSKRSAEGQVDGADDMSTSLSEDSGEEEEGGLGQCPSKDSYYYNFTRTIINSNARLHPVEGAVGRGSQFGRFLNEDAGEGADHMDESGAIPLSLGRPQIGQLDGVDDGSESDASLSTSTTTTATTSTTHKTSVKRKSRESRAERMAAGSGKDSDSSAGGGNGSSRESRKNQKESCLSLVAVKSQGQDPLEAQLSLTTDLLKSDSDNNYSDDCGNILPSDIMDFVLNTPSMQALGQQAESSSPELLLGEGYGVDVNRRKESSLLFDIPLPSTEPGESGVSSTISVEESYSLQLGLPSDLSVLTTRSPSVSNQNHSTLIPEASESTMLSLTTDESVEKAGDKPGVRTSEATEEGGGGESQVADDRLTPKHFITGMEGEHISGQVSQVIEPDNQDVARTPGTPGLPSSPTLPLQNQKYIPVTAVSPGPSQVASTAVQTPSSHLKPTPTTEKLIVVNQRMQPLYVLQTLPNGVTQKIQIAPPVGAAGVITTSPSVLSSMTLTASINPTQPIFPAGGKGLLPMSHHPQIHTIANTTQASFQPVIPNTTSGLLIGIPSHDQQIIVSEAGHRADLAPSVAMVSSVPSLSPSSAVLSSGGKKRPISRIQPRKSKKLPRSRSQPPLAPSEVAPNMTLINLSSPQITAGISTQSGLVELGTLTTAATTSHRKMPNIIKRPKPGVMLVPQPMPISSSAQTGILAQDTSAHLLPCTVSGLNPNQPVLNVVSVPQSGAGNIIGAGSVSLSTPGILSSTEIGNLLFKAGPTVIPDQQMVLHPGGPMMSPLAHPVQTSIASSICVLPPQQTLSMPVGKPTDQDSALHRTQVNRIMADKPQALDPSGSVTGSMGPAPGLLAQDPTKPMVGVFTQGSWTTPITLQANQQQVFKSTATAAPPAAGGKGKQKAKRIRATPEKTSGKKPKGLQAESPLPSQRDGTSAARQLTSGTKQPANPEPMDTGQPIEKDSSKSDAPVMTKASPINQVSVELSEEESKATALTSQKGFSTVPVASSEQDEGKANKDFLSHYKPKKGLMFEISSDDGFQIRCESIEEAWKSLTDKVKEARSNAKLKELSFEGVNGLRMLGVLHHTVLFLLEQLYGARHCRNYRFRFHKPKEPDEPPINPRGSARVELHHRRSVFDMFNFLASRHRQPPQYNPQEEEEEEVQLKSARRAISIDLPMSTRLQHLKKTSRETVGVYRSAIHGRGLFCKRNIDAGEMIIEYSGNIVRSVLTDKREKYYDEKGIGCYMFRIDDYEVVDATMHGNAARFINHSCEPNCYSRVIIVDAQKHIVIFALRKIYRGEELTYDYKFPIEEPGNKLPCNCGAKKCRKFLN